MYNVKTHPPNFDLRLISFFHFLKMSQNNIKTLTPKQKKVYEYIHSYIGENSISPTVLEIAEKFCFSSLRTVTQYLESLEKKGLISRSPYQKRGIKILQFNPFSQTVTLPIVSSAGCDNLSVFADPKYDEYVTLDREFLHDKNPQEVVVFKAVGNSMVDAGINTGDWVLTDITENIVQKDKVVAIVDGMAVIKQIHFSPNAVILSPMSNDPQYRPIIMKKDFKVFGKVLDVIKNSWEEELVYESL